MASRAVVGTIWHQPSAQEVADAADTKLRLYINRRYGLKLQDYWALHRFSLSDPNAFYSAVWDFTNVLGDHGDVLFDGTRPIDSATPTMDARVNFAENMLLSHSSARSKRVMAVIGVTEPPADRPREPQHLRSLSFDGLYDEVRRAAWALKALGVKKGDVVAAYTPNNVECCVMTVAALSFGAIMTTVGADSGVQGVLERFQQVEPVVLLTAANYRYNGKVFSTLDKVESVVESLARAKLRHVIVVDQLSPSRELDPASLPQRPSGVKHHTWSGFMAAGKDAPATIEFPRFESTHPCYILYSSGTTGKPKAIIHQTGGQVLAFKLTRTFHGGLKAGDLELQACNANWMMLQHTFCALLVGAGLITYDGSPLQPPSVLFDIVDRYKVTGLGVSPRYLAVLETAKYYPRDRHSLKSLEGIGTTGAPLRPEQYPFISEKIFGRSMPLSNGSGGTDICGPFVTTVPSLPTRIGEITAPVLGIQVEAWSEAGRPVYTEQGNMVITKPFPNQPLGFVGDPDRKRLQETYYSSFKTPVWDQADFISFNPHTGGCTIYGRADGTLNPSGVRFGSSELYNVVEDMGDAIDDSLAIGHRFNGEERVILFVKTRDDKPVTEELEKRIKTAIRTALTSRHVPSLIIKAPDLPYGATGKKLEIPVKKLINGADRKSINYSSCVNPEAFEFFRPTMPELFPDRTAPKPKL